MKAVALGLLCLGLANVSAYATDSIETQAIGASQMFDLAVPHMAMGKNQNSQAAQTLKGLKNIKTSANKLHLAVAKQGIQIQCDVTVPGCRETLAAFKKIKTPEDVLALSAEVQTMLANKEVTAKCDAKISRCAEIMAAIKNIKDPASAQILSAALPTLMAQAGMSVKKCDVTVPGCFPAPQYEGTMGRGEAALNGAGLGAFIGAVVISPIDIGLMLGAMQLSGPMGFALLFAAALVGALIGAIVGFITRGKI